MIISVNAGLKRSTGRLSDPTRNGDVSQVYSFTWKSEKNQSTRSSAKVSELTFDDISTIVSCRKSLPQKIYRRLFTVKVGDFPAIDLHPSKAVVPIENVSLSIKLERHSSIIASTTRSGSEK
jgi:hypothetical protein